ncbi:hypothetical protein D3C87_1969830 [compost metagenome]
MASAYSAERIEAKSIVQSARNAALGWLSVKRTWSLSTASTLVISLSSPVSVKYS